MADDNEKPARSQADKEHSRQQSRAVSGKEAARGVARAPGRGSATHAGQKGGPKGGQPKGAAQKGGGGQKGTVAKGGGPARGDGAKRPATATNRGGGAATRPRQGRSGPVPAPRRSPTALLTWGLVALVLVIVIVLVVVKITGSTPPSSAPAAGPVPASVVSEVTHIPASVYNTIGVSSPSVTVHAPTALKGQPGLTSGGKPEVFYMGGEFCPFCAAERWALVASFSRFSTVTGLKTMASSASDTDPSTQTFSFVDAHFASPYVTITTREYYSNQENSAGTGYSILQPLSKSQSALVSKYNTAKYTGGSTTTSGSIPFVDIGNRFLVSGSSYTPSILQGLKRTAIAAGLSTVKDPVTRAIVASSNYLSASICSADSEKPASVCTSKGVAAADKAMGLSS